MENGTPLQINGQDILKFQKDFRLGRQSVTLLAKTTWENRERGTQYAEGIEYSEIKNYVKQNFLNLVEKDKIYYINVLTSQGWRGGKTFHRNYVTERDFFDPKIEYDDDTPIQEIFGLQIIYH
jgi:hypothetical protein